MNTEINKAVVSLLSGVATIVAMFGITADWATPEMIASMGAVIGTILVFLVPNKPALPPST